MSDHTPGTSPEDIERYRVHFTRYGGWLQGADWPGRNVSPVVQALCTEVRRLRAELAEARATIAAEQGKPEGALPGWDWIGTAWRLLEAGLVAASVHRIAAGKWGCQVRRRTPRHSEHPTAREAMRAAVEPAKGADDGREVTP